MENINGEGLDDKESRGETFEESSSSLSLPLSAIP
jgi:hypothetical protein